MFFSHIYLFTVLRVTHLPVHMPPPPQGNVVNIQTGQWVSKQSGLGAGMDSFYEYLLKSYILFGEKEDYRMFSAAYESIQIHLRRG